MQSRSPHDLASYTVLVVEDERLLRLMCAEALQDVGLTVLEAQDGQAGLDVVKAQDSIDLLITDVKMPRLNGYQLAAAALEIRPNLKLLFMTAYTQPFVPTSIPAATRTIKKPFDVDEFSACALGLLMQIP